MSVRTTKPLFLSSLAGDRLRLGKNLKPGHGHGQAFGGRDHTTLFQMCITLSQSTRRKLTMRHRERCIAAIQWLAENLAREALRELLRSFFR
jgi:hypothetical protein